MSTDSDQIIERLQSDLILAAEIGQSLLEQNTLLSLEKTRLEGEVVKYEQKVEELSKELEEACQRDFKLKQQLRLTSKLDAEDHFRESLEAVEQSKKETESSLSATRRQLRKINTERVALQNTIKDLSSQNEELLDRNSLLQLSLSRQRIHEGNSSVFNSKSRISESTNGAGGGIMNLKSFDNLNYNRDDVRRLSTGSSGLLNVRSNLTGSLTPQLGPKKPKRSHLMNMIISNNDAFSSMGILGTESTSMPNSTTSLVPGQSDDDDDDGDEDDGDGETSEEELKQDEDRTPRATSIRPLPNSNIGMAGGSKATSNNSNLSENQGFQRVLDPVDTSGLSLTAAADKDSNPMLGNMTKSKARRSKSLSRSNEPPSRNEQTAIQLTAMQKENKELRLFIIDLQDNIDIMRRKLDELESIVGLKGLSRSRDELAELNRPVVESRMTQTEEAQGSIPSVNVEKGSDSNLLSNNTSVSLTTEDLNGIEQLKNSMFPLGTAALSLNDITQQPHQQQQSQPKPPQRPKPRGFEFEDVKRKQTTTISSITDLSNTKLNNVDAVTFIMRGGWLLKYTRKGAKHLRYVSVNPFKKTLSWYSRSVGDADPVPKSIVMVKFNEIDDFDDLAIIIHTKDRKYKFEAGSVNEHHLWVMGLNTLFKETTKSDDQALSNARKSLDNLRASHVSLVTNLSARSSSLIWAKGSQPGPLTAEGSTSAVLPRTGSMDI
ncbi:hypothetical protein HDU76_012957 [Blyttiomyces sp. JEL0837]|nr:hypothetical protein HDU76_012957 [Blyttiomyces sp. JEL0837]